jgi:feruloyl-CoA synthase
MIALLAPHVRDVVLCGADRDALTMLLVGDGADDETVRTTIRTRLATFAAEHPGSSTHIRRAIFLDTPPSIEAGEITDKGSLNNAIVRERRRHLIERLYAPDVDAHVISIS